MFLTVLALSAALFQDATVDSDPVVEAVYATDSESLTGYMAQSCRIQQAANQGGTSVEYTEFCGCLAGEIRDGTGDELFRAMALGSQGALQDEALIDDWDAAREESEAIFATLEPEEQLSAGTVIQSGLLTCLPLMPAHVE
tara:strand:+ start:6030 stop:6452 length:423 start_codon:yes stop_codon:yes gene_type:complete